MKEGIPAWRIPWQFTANETSEQDYGYLFENSRKPNETHVVRNSIEDNTNIVESPWQIANDIGSGLIFLPLVSMIQIIAIVHNFSRKYQGSMKTVIKI